MKRVTTHPLKRSRQERALQMAEDRVTYWKIQVGLPDEKRNPVAPNGRCVTYAPEQKLAAAKADVANLRAKGVTLPEVSTDA